MLLYCFEAKDKILRNHSNRTLWQYFDIVFYLFLYNKIVLFVTVNYGVLEGSLVYIFCQSEKPRGNIFFFFFFFFKLSPCKSDFTVGLRNHIDVIDILNGRIYEISVSPHRLLSDYRTKSFSTNKF